MSRRLKQAALAFVVVFAAAQLVRPERVNPATDFSRTIQAHVATASGLGAVLDRACSDCHSNKTVWPWYTQVAPASWLMAYAVAEGRKVVNFSEWAAYSPEEQRMLLALSCDNATNGKMPGAYTLLHPEMQLSARDIETICRAAREGTERGRWTLSRRHGGTYEDRNARNRSARLSGSEAHRDCRRVSQQEPPPRRQFDLSAAEEVRARCLSNESAHADVRGRSLLSRPAIDPWWGGVVIITRPEITEQIVHECDEAGVRRVWMHQSMKKGSSVSKAAVEYCHEHGMNVIAGACPMMYGADVDFGHTCIHWILKLTGGLPT